MNLSFDSIQILYPRGVRTGGPEALHQLGRALLDLGIDASLVAHPASRGHQRVAAYDVYDVPEQAEIRDEPGTMVVLSELDISRGRSLVSALPACWWLSIGNAPYFEAASNAALVRGPGPGQRLRQAKWDVLAHVERRRFEQPWLRRTVHLTQSEHAWSSLFHRAGIRASMLSDYTNDATTTSPPPRAGALRPVVSYNASKGGPPARQVAAAMGPGVEFVAIEAMSPAEVRSTLERSTVYLDLGRHPGKDRLPREAALAGCVVLVARRGSGSYSLDVPIPDDHKIDIVSTPTSDVIDVDSVVRLIREVLGRTVHHHARQHLMRRAVLGERDRFATEVERIFVHGILGASTNVTDLVDPAAPGASPTPRQARGSASVPSSRPVEESRQSPADLPHAP